MSEDDPVRGHGGEVSPWAMPRSSPRSWDPTCPGWVSVLCPAGPCTLHVLAALDVTDYQQSNLQPYLERVLRDLAALDHLTCSPLGLSITLQSTRRDGDTVFQERLREPWADVLQRLAQAHAFQRSYLTQPGLQSFLGTLAQQEAVAKV